MWKGIKTEAWNAGRGGTTKQVSVSRACSVMACLELQRWPQGLAKHDSCFVSSFKAMGRPWCIRKGSDAVRLGL